MDVFGLDAPADIRDIAYDLINWKWSWRHAGQTAIDIIALAPVIGALKYTDEAGVLLKNSDEAAAAIKSMGKGGDDLVDVAGDFRRNHILYGDKTGGSHLWPGSSGKSIFPKTWDADTVMHHVSDIATDPNITWQKGRIVKGIQRYEVIGVRDGVIIKVITDGKDIITAFPID